MIFWVFDRWGKQTGCIGDVQEAVHRDELNGEDSLTLVLPENALKKGDRVAWRDKWDAWHEHIVSEVTMSHADGSTYFSAYCENSFAETLLDYVDEVVCEDVKAPVALARALAPSRWRMGTVDDLGTSSLYCFQTSVHEAVSKAIEAWGGEYSTEVRVEGEGVSERTFNLEAMRGQDAGKLFAYGHDMSAVEQTVGADDVVTRLHAFGKGTGYTDPEAGYTERLTFASVNGGRDYVEDDDAKMLWGLPDGRGGAKHAEGVAVFEDCDDEEELLGLARAELERRSHPHVTYKATVAALADYGYEYDDVRPGDAVALRDKPLDLRLAGRVAAVTRYLVDTGATEVTLGDEVRSITDVLGQQAADLAWLRSRSRMWNDASGLNAAYLNRVIDRLNEQMNATGGYAYWEEGVGITVYDRPKDQNPTQAIQLNGMGFRVANAKKASGEWDWRTFGTGDGFVADELVTGVIHCGANTIDLTNGVVTLKDGMIQDADGTNYWNLATGILRTLRGYIGGFTIGASALYNGPSALDSTARGVYLGTDGISSSDGSNRLVLEAGRMSGYQGQVKAGELSPNATVREVDENGASTGAIWRGMRMMGGIFEIRTSKLAVLDEDSTQNASRITSTEKLNIHELQPTSATSKSVVLKPWSTTLDFTHGMLTRSSYVGEAAREVPLMSYVEQALGSKADADDLDSKADADDLDSKADKNHTHNYASLTNRPLIPTFQLSGTVLRITTATT